MTALPPVSQTSFQPSSEPHNAYIRCLKFEESTGKATSQDQTRFSEVVGARLLGYLLIYAPSPDSLAREITSAEDDAALYDLAKLYLNRFIGCCESPS
jgi:hypothetical protein